MTRLALVAADWALADAGRRPGRAGPTTTWAWSPPAPPAASSSASGELQKLWSKGSQLRQRVPVLRLVLRGQHRPDLHPARHARARAASWSPTRPAAWTPSARPGGRSARARALVVTGGVDALAVPVGLGRPARQRPAEHRDDPARAYLPFDREAARLRARRGRRDPRRWRTPAAAAERGAPRVYGEIAGYAATFDPPPGTRPRAGPAPGDRAAPWPTPALAPGRGRRGVRRRGRACPSWTGPRPRRSPRSSARTACR